MAYALNFPSQAWKKKNCKIRFFWEIIWAWNKLSLKLRLRWDLKGPLWEPSTGVGEAIQWTGTVFMEYVQQGNASTHSPVLRQLAAHVSLSRQCPSWGSCSSMEQLCHRFPDIIFHSSRHLWENHNHRASNNWFMFPFLSYWMNSASMDSRLSPHALLEAQNTQVSFEARPQSSAFPLWGYYLFKQMYKRSLQGFTCSFGVSFLTTTPRVSHVP